MPFKSKAQQRFLFARHPKVARKFADETAKATEKAGPIFKNLPKRKGKKGREALKRALKRRTRRRK